MFKNGIFVTKPFQRWQPRRWLSSVERNTGGVRVQARAAEIERGGDRGGWSVVRSRKWKATQPEERGWDWFRDTERQGGMVQGKGIAEKDFGRSDWAARGQVRVYDHQVSRQHAFDSKSNTANLRDRVSFYFTNIPKHFPGHRLRHYFEVCGILSDVFVARRPNARGQVYGFVRFLNVKNRDKLGQALNNIWIGDCCVWAREARFDRFATFDEDFREEKRDRSSSLRVVEAKPVVITHGEGIVNVRLRKEAEVEKESEGK
ncbi:hypothetical protein MTR_5g049880 [Medicago truncatula]|uniref:RRM domain-containing protein n=1 Tax=Medicago truncatula TaxID=3880 RepID=A0A072UFQ7_MEDTR|nr:hypothetical protein MTR_6g045577 [Medicago truncatula]KEH27948.1 hypothetical protein MTR_5g049880 [Medicago truncatula]